MHLGATLRLLRTDAGLTLRALAERIGVSTAYLSRVENGHDAPPTPERLVAIARALGLPPQDLVDLAQRVSPVVSSYMDHVPIASLLFLDIARKHLTAAQLARVKAFVDAEFPMSARTPGAPRVSLTALLSSRRIIANVSCESLNDAIDIAATRLVRCVPTISARELADAITTREHVSSSALGSGVAVPHALVPSATPAAALVVLARPLKLPTPDDVPLRVAIVHVHPRAGTELLQLLAHIALLARHQLAEILPRSRDVRQAIEELEALCS